MRPCASPVTLCRKAQGQNQINYRIKVCCCPRRIQMGDSHASHQQRPTEESHIQKDTPPKMASQNILFEFSDEYTILI